MAISPTLYYGLIFVILGSVTLLLARLKVNAIFYWTFFLLGSIYMSVSVWEALNEEWLGMTHTYWIGGVAHFYWFSLWWMTIGIASIGFFVMYLVYQIHVSHYIAWGKTIALGVLIAGLAMIFGVLEDLGVFTMWGFEHFNLTDAPWHQQYINNLFPTFYLWLIPGIVLTVIALSWTAQHRPTKPTLRIPLVCPPNNIGFCVPAELSADYADYQLCLTKEMQVCIKK